MTNSKGFSCLINWREIYMPKKYGSLGVLNLQYMNQTLVAKWLWKFSHRDGMS